MAEGVSVGCGGAVLLEDVVRHIAVSFLGVGEVTVLVESGVLGALVLQSGPNHVIDHILLLFSKRVEDLLDSVTVCGVLEGFLLGLHLGLLGLVGNGLLEGLLLLGPINRLLRMLKCLTGVNNSFVIKDVNFAVRVTDRNIVDECAGVGARQNKAHLTNNSVKDLLAPLDQLVGVDRHRGDVAVTHQGLGVVGRFGGVEICVCIHTIFPVLENRVAQYVARIVVSVLPNKRNLLPVVDLERVRHNGPAVGALETSLGCVTAKVSSHFDCLLPFGGPMPAQPCQRLWLPVPACYCFLAHRP